MRFSTSLIASAVASLCVAGISAAGTEGDLRGVWKPQRYVASIRTTDGKLPPLLPDELTLWRP